MIPAAAAQASIPAAVVIRVEAATLVAGELEEPAETPVADAIRAVTVAERVETPVEAATQAVTVAERVATPVAAATQADWTVVAGCAAAKWDGLRAVVAVRFAARVANGSRAAAGVRVDSSAAEPAAIPEPDDPAADADPLLAVDAARRPEHDCRILVVNREQAGPLQGVAPVRDGSPRDGKQEHCAHRLRDGFRPPFAVARGSGWQTARGSASRTARNCAGPAAERYADRSVRQPAVASDDN